MLAEKYGWSIEYILDLTRVQIKLLSNGQLEILELQETIKDEMKDNAKNPADYKKYFSKGNKNNKMTMSNKSEKTSGKDSDSFYSLFSLPGIKMTDKAKQKFIESKKIKGN